MAGTALLIVAARRLQRFEVEGASMLPTLEPGDRLLLLRSRRLTAGDVVVVPDPRDGRLVVKRATAVGIGTLDVAGDNPAASTDSRTYGPVPAGSARGRVLYRYHPPDRRGFLGRVR